MRMKIVEKFMRDYKKDVMCLKEKKWKEEMFKEKGFSEIGYENIEIRGKKGYKGVEKV